MKILVSLLCFLFCFTLSSPSRSADSTFRQAIISNNLSDINRLAAQTDDIDQRGTNGKTALMVAAKAGDSALVKNLMDAGANPNAENINGGTPVMFAAITGDKTTLKILIKAGVDISARGSNGWSALMVAAAKGHVEATRLILDAGAEVNTTDVYLWTPLHRAVYENQTAVIEILLSHESVDIHHRDEHGATALHHAAARGNSKVVAMLLQNGASTSSPDFSGRLPSIYASNNGHPYIANMLEDPG
jgi:ankyrin repeat protein